MGVAVIERMSSLVACAVVLACALTPSLAHAAERSVTTTDSLEPTVTPPPPPPPPTTVTFVAVGDMMAHKAQLSSAFGTGGYDFRPAFAPVRPLLSSADVAIGNLETTLAHRAYTGYPCFKSPMSYVSAAKWAGLDVLTTANNHALDGGRGGVSRTIAELDRLRIAHVGTRSTSGSRIVYRTVKGVRVAYLAYTEHTNGIRSPDPYSVNRLSSWAVRDVKEAAAHSDLVIVSVHWGNEYTHAPEKRVTTMARALTAAGADVVLGSHPHVIRPLVVRDGKAVIYSLGNFVSAMNKGRTDLGVALRFTATKSDGRTTLGGVTVTPLYRDHTSGAGRRSWRVVRVSDAVRRFDGLISTSDKAEAVAYRRFCAEMYGRRLR